MGGGDIETKKHFLSAGSASRLADQGPGKHGIIGN